MISEKCSYGWNWWSTGDECHLPKLNMWFIACSLKGHPRDLLGEELSSICMFDIEEWSVRVE